MGFGLALFLLDSSAQKGISPGLPSGGFHEGMNAWLSQLVLLCSFPTRPSPFLSCTLLVYFVLQTQLKEFPGGMGLQELFLLARFVLCS